jgi:hypothetical protein
METRPARAAIRRRNGRGSNGIIPACARGHNPYGGPGRVGGVHFARALRHAYRFPE